MKAISKFAAVGIAAFLAIQAIHPAITRPPVTAEVDVPPPVKQILANSCYSCHSNNPTLLWFDQLAPVYWLVRHDVTEARSRLNFSELGKLPAGAQRAALFEAVNQVRFGAMPLPSYLHAHPNARVTPQQLAILEQYLQPFPPSLASDPQKLVAASTSDRPPTPIQPAPNGLAFFPDYKNWRPISSTDRGDNRTLRQILGNEIAVKAIAQKKIQPWPDGAAFAKVAWEAATDQQGITHAGKFLQVEFMVKGQTQYASTAGWGFGRWKGLTLTPYGKDAAFADECVGCHAPLRNNDFVFTSPVERIAE